MGCLAWLSTLSLSVTEMAHEKGQTAEGDDPQQPLTTTRKNSSKDSQAAYTRIYAREYIHTHTDIRIHVHTQIHIHTDTRACTHTHTFSL